MKDALYAPDFSSRLEGASLFIQWKGTNVCSDFHCDCGQHVHICDVDFLYGIKCHACGQVWKTPHTVRLEKAQPGEEMCVHETRQDAL